SQRGEGPGFVCDVPRPPEDLEAPLQHHPGLIELAEPPQRCAAEEARPGDLVLPLPVGIREPLNLHGCLKGVLPTSEPPLGSLADAETTQHEAGECVVAV